ncbi:MAG: CPBP family intramembrane metalloprotease [Clostridiales bacterium]|nr:CPBP family intramembrane metalloprotease [Clostridiales bacterium]
MTQEMTPYTPKPMSRRDLRKCYSRFSISVILMVALAQLMGAGLYYGAARFFPQYYRDAFWGPILALAINDVSVYLPGLVLFPLVLRRMPKGSPIPVDRLSLWEFVQAAVFSFGVGYGCSLLTSLSIYGLEHLTGQSTSNVVDSFSASLPIWLTAVAFVLVAPVMEELIFRRILLRRLLGLGDVSAVVLSALAFALFHANLYQTAYAFVLGLVFGAVVLLTGSIRDTILLHMLINGFSVVMQLNLPDEALVAASVVIYLSIGIAIAMFLAVRRGYHMEPGPLPFSAREKRRACRRSVWFWVMLGLGLAYSAATIFL